MQRITKVTKYNSVESFSVKRDGMEVLKNINKNNKFQCFFLNAKGTCSIYDLRPEGCRYYPVVWDLDYQKAIVHDFCPHHEEFRSEIHKVSSQVEKLVTKLVNLSTLAHGASCESVEPRVGKR
jgi:Fe-S-cluster containining protein